MLNFNHFYYFYVAASSKSVTAAASMLRISQPTLSIQIKTLERNIGRALMNKQGRELVLTEEGKRIYEQCRRMFEIGEELETSLSGAVQPRPSRMHVGVSREIDRLFVTRLIEPILANRIKSDTSQVRISTADHDIILERLEQRTLDCVLTTQETHLTRFETIGFRSFPVVLGFKKSLIGKGEANPKDLKDTVRRFENFWVLPSHDLRLRTETDRFFERSRIAPAIRFESDILATLGHAAAAGLGMALLPEPYFRDFKATGDIAFVRPTSGGFWQSRIYLIARSKRQQPALVAELGRIFSETIFV